MIPYADWQEVIEIVVTAGCDINGEAKSKDEYYWLLAIMMATDLSDLKVLKIPVFGDNMKQRDIIELLQFLAKQGLKLPRAAVLHSYIKNEKKTELSGLTVVISMLGGELVSVSNKRHGNFKEKTKINQDKLKQMESTITNQIFTIIGEHYVQVENNVKNRITETVEEMMTLRAKALPPIETDKKLVNLNIGGTLFTTTTSTLTKYYGTRFAALVEQSNQIIDRDPGLFRIILNYVRDGDVSLPDTQLALLDLLNESKHYEISPLEEKIKNKMYVLSLKTNTK